MCALASVCLRVDSHGENQHVVLSAPKGQLYHCPVNHIGSRQNVFITVDNVSFVMDNVKNNSVTGSHFLVDGCAAEAQNENSCEPSCL